MATWELKSRVKCKVFFKLNSLNLNLKLLSCERLKLKMLVCKKIIDITQREHFFVWNGFLQGSLIFYFI